MIDHVYDKQIHLLLKVLPEVAKETCFALHGGTAINLFFRNMPRLSVDIDLTYTPIEDRQQSIDKINRALAKIESRIIAILPGIKVQHKYDISKLIISFQGAEIKLEVNLVGRGTLKKPDIMLLCEQAATKYKAFVAIQVMPIGQLYGGKICAALDRQHPRDLFDIKFLMNDQGLTEEVKEGFLLSLISGSRPIHEILNPNLLDQRAAMKNQFMGMTTEPFTYDDFEITRNVLIAAVQWKLQNLEKLKTQYPAKYQEHNERLRALFDQPTT